ncbi:MAG: PilZ domain-containing protein [Myxococcota bacterium]
MEGEHPPGAVGLLPAGELGWQGLRLMQEPIKGDRRKYHRIGTDQVICFAKLDSGDQLALSRNLSSGGLRFEAVGCEIELGEFLRVTFNIGDETVSAVGRVAWATDTDPLSMDIGLEFLEIDPEVLRLLEEVQEP